MHQHPKMKYTYCGIDSHKATHTAVFIDCFHELLGEITFSTSPSAFDDFLSQAQQYLLPNTEFAFGMEDISAYGRTLAQFLLKNNHLVKHCDATLVATEREAKNVLHKTDEVDALSCAVVLLNRFNTLPNALQQDKLFILSSLVTRRDFIAKTNMMAASQLHSFIYEHYPSYKKFFSRIDGNASIAFFEKYPSPSTLQGVTEDALAAFLTSVSRNQGLPKAQMILDSIKHDGVPVSPHQQARDFTIRSIARQMKTGKVELKLIDAQIDDFLTHFNYNLTDIKGINTTTMAKFIVEIGDISRFKNAKALAKYAGVSPVVHSSGESSVNYANRKGNRKLNELFYRLAIIQALPRGKDYTLINPLFHDYYKKKISEGKTRRQAIKSVQRRLVNIIFNMLKHGTHFINPDARKLNEATNQAS